MFNVTSLLDNGAANTFRQAIMGVIANPGSTISFAIGAQGSTQTIVLNAVLGALPTISVPTLIDGFSQNGGTRGTYIELNGNQIGATGLTVSAGGVEIRGLAIDNFNGTGIALNNPLGSAADLVWRCNIGTDCTGVKAGVGNTFDGIYVTGANDIIGALNRADGNVVSGNGANGVDLSGTSAKNDSVLGNYIGVDATGTKTLANVGQGVYLQLGASTNVIGGDAAGHSIDSGNVIAGNGGSGVYLNQANSNQILDNYIGLGSDGTTAVANASEGVGIWNTSSNNIIGGEDGFSGNYISGNGRNGVLLTGPGVTGNKLFDNWIGLAADGTARGNATNGVRVDSCSSNFVGGSNAHDRNVISANLGCGVLLSGSGGMNNNNTVAGNYIGTNAAGTAALGNGLDGVQVSGRNNIIGGTGDNGRNVISGNKQAGVDILGGNLITVAGNYIGTDVTGKLACGNRLYGIIVQNDTANLIGSTQNTIGAAIGANGLPSNVISGNGTSGSLNKDYGIYIGSGVTGTTIIGCYIGLGADGTSNVGNGNSGIYTEINSSGTTIGGEGNGVGNFISFNGKEADTDGEGVEMCGNNSLIQNNVIGLDVNYAIAKNEGGWMSDSGTGNVWNNNIHN